MSLSYSTEVFRAILIVFIGLSSVLEVHGQSDSTTSLIEWPDGLYYTPEEFLSQEPRFSPKLLLFTRDSGDISFMGGNPFKFSCLDYKVDETDIWKKVLIVKHEGQLYINALLLDRGFGFARCETEGPFIVAYLNLHDYEDRKLTAGSIAGVTGGIVGGALGGVIGGAVVGAIAGAITSGIGKSDLHLLYVHSLRTGNSRLLTRAYIEARFADFPDLLSRFKEENPGTEEPVDEVKIKYINLLNERVGLN